MKMTINKPIYRTVFCLTLCCVLSLAAGAQNQGQAETVIEKEVPDSPEAYLKKYNERIKKEILFDVYIPMDVEDAIEELNRLTDQSSIDKFKQAPEEVVSRKMHFGLGRWIEHNWGFYEGSRLSHYLKGKGVAHPDDMVRFLIISWHRSLNNTDQDFEGRIKAIEEKVKKEKAERDKDKKVISIERKKKEN